MAAPDGSVKGSTHSAWDCSYMICRPRSLKRISPLWMQVALNHSASISCLRSHNTAIHTITSTNTYLGAIALIVSIRVPILLPGAHCVGCWVHECLRHIKWLWGTCLVGERSDVCIESEWMRLHIGWHWQSWSHWLHTTLCSMYASSYNFLNSFIQKVICRRALQL